MEDQLVCSAGTLDLAFFTKLCVGQRDVYFTRLACTFSGMKTLEIRYTQFVSLDRSSKHVCCFHSDSNITVQSLMKLLTLVPHARTISVYRCFCINRVNLQDILVHPIASVALGAVSLSFSNLRPLDVFDKLEHLVLPNCTFLEQFYCNMLLFKMLQGHFPKLSVLCLSAAMVADEDGLVGVDLAQAAQLMVARSLESTPVGSIAPREIVIDYTYAQNSIVAFLLDLRRELDVQNHWLRLVLVDMSRDPLWALQPLKEMPVSLKRALFVAHPERGKKTLLHETAITGDLPRMQWLVQNGALLNLRDAAGCSALLRAAEYNNVGCVEYLLERRADLWVKNREQESAVFRAAMLGHAAVLTMLISHMQKHEDQSIGERLDRECGDTKQFTPLQIAIIRQSEACLQLLLDVGCSPHQTNAHGQQALHVAINVNFPRAVELLLQRGVDINARDGMGLTPLDYACKYKHRRTREFSQKACATTHGSPTTGDALPTTTDSPLDLETLIESLGGQASKRTRQKPRKKTGRSRS